MRVAYQGEPGAYSEQALFEYFGEVETKPCEAFDVVFKSVASNVCETGLIPIENSLAGSVHENYDLLFRHELFIVGEYILRVRHCLIALPGVAMGNIKKAMSHPQALAQCANYLRDHGIQAEAVYDTAGGVKMLKESRARDTAAIASRRAAEMYGMQILEEGIEDDLQNYTRFLAISKTSLTPHDETKTSLVFILNSQPGSLLKALNVFALHDIDLTRIESRPLRGKPWEYLFFIDIIGATQGDSIRGTLEQLREYTSMLRVLGSYSRYKG